MKAILAAITISVFAVNVHADECETAKWGADCTIKVDVSGRLVSKGLYTFPSGTKVTVVVAGLGPFQKATFDVKRSDLQPPPSVLESLGPILKDASGSALFFAANAKASSAAAKASNLQVDKKYSVLKTLDAAKKTTTTAVVIDRLQALVEASQAKNTEIQEAADTYDRESDAISRFFKDLNQYPTRNDLIKSVAAQIGTPLPSVVGIQAELNALRPLLQTLLADPDAAADAKLALVLLDRLGGLHEEQTYAIGKLKDARKDLENILQILNNLPADPNKVTTIDIVSDKNAELDGDLVISSILPGDSDQKRVHLKIDFVDVPRAVVAAGVLISNSPRTDISVQRFATGDPFRVKVSSNAPQVIPFSFIHVRLGLWKCGGRLCTWNLSPGIGVNPNNGSTQTEFAAALSLGVGNGYFSFGLHEAREPFTTNGFSNGFTVDSADVKVPVANKWRPRFGFAITYRLPVK